ncbi:MAG: ferrochelatase [Gammaproteobacteria bacterium]|nr:ferrochelatase [Gammaproteobacteria bacterium]
MTAKAVLLINLGTPQDCSRMAVWRYLRDFLIDRRVIDLPAMIRWPLVNLIIAPFRSKKSALAYRKINTAAGLPLRVYGYQLQQRLAEALTAEYQVELAMRYGEPSVAHALQRLKSCQQLTIIPLFPQYSSAATGSVIEQVMQQLSRQNNIPTVKVYNQFYQHPGFIAAYVQRIQHTLAEEKSDGLLFSYHSVPERHINKSGCRGECDRLQPCPAIDESNRHCYRAQCYQTSRLLAQQLKLPEASYQTVFQSRLGRIPWVQPYLDRSLQLLIERGVRRIAIVSPSFVNDCLETLEEIAIRSAEQWRALGGETLIAIPCLNSDTCWVEALVEMVKTPGA